MEIVALLFVVIAGSAAFMMMRAKAHQPKGAGAAAPAATGKTNGKVNGKARATAKGNTAAKTAAAAPRLPFRATSITFDTSACDAAKALGKKRFLDRDRDVPGLPLAACDKSQCTCKYAHHDDRRDASEDRRHPAALKSQLYERGEAPNKREKQRGRRKTDWA
jgi:hypothetical protein